MSTEQKRGGVKAELERFAAWREANRPSITTAVVAVREATVRRALKIKKSEPLVYLGLTVRCIGSKRWRDENGTPGTRP